MRVEWSEMAGVEMTSPSEHADERGTFTKLYAGGPDQVDRLSVAQVVVTHNLQRGTVRGLHVQVAPHLETKTLWCSSGEVWDVLVDTRSDQPSHGHWTANRLQAGVPHIITVPPGVAHGYQTLADASTLVYLIEGVHVSHSARTLAWDDPVVGIDWPLSASVISQRDRAGAPWPVS